jgi:hypothetical protein
VLGKPPELLDKRPDDLEAAFAAKTHFCAFVVSNAGRRKTQRRVDFFHRLSRYKPVDSAGRAYNNIGGPLVGGGEAKIEFLRRYKFNIAFENASLPGYTTEKIFEAMVARCLPIYWGSPRIHEEFNHKSFLNYHDFASEDALIERIVELDRDDAKYLEVMRQPYMVNDQPNEFFSVDRLSTFFDRIFSTPISPVARKRHFLELNRWLLARKNRPVEG